MIHWLFHSNQTTEKRDWSGAERVFDSLSQQSIPKWAFASMLDKVHHQRETLIGYCAIFRAIFKTRERERLIPVDSHCCEEDIVLEELRGPINGMDFGQHCRSHHLSALEKLLVAEAGMRFLQMKDQLVSGIRQDTYSNFVASNVELIL